MLPLGAGGTVGGGPVDVVAGVVGVVVAGVAVAVVVVAVVGAAVSPSESGSGFTMVKMGGGRVSTQQGGKKKNEEKKDKSGAKKKGDFVFQTKSFFSLSSFQLFPSDLNCSSVYRSR